MNILNNPYLYHPHPLLKAAADDICLHIKQKPEWDAEFSKGKMLGVLLCDTNIILRAYSGIVKIEDPDGYFVPAVYDLSNPDDFYLQEDQEISAINARIATETDTKTLVLLKARRKELSQNLQLKIFSHFNFINPSGRYKNIVDIFSESKRGLPPGGAGECAAPRLLQYALSHGLKPLAIAEFWYGVSPKKEVRAHRQFYPSCIEKCSPILSFMLGASGIDNEAPASLGQPKIIAEDEHLIVVSKPSGLLSTPAKDLSQPNVETWLHETHPEVKGPMLAHRLDQATSGLLLAAKDAQTHKWLQQGFEQKTIRKRYVAWLDGHLPSDCGFISLPICTNPDDRPRQTVDWQFGKMAQTRYNVLKRVECRVGSVEWGVSSVEGEKIIKERTLVEFFPLTGRTHQLRLHAASPFGLNCPISGDKLYFAEQAKRLMLHAESVKLPSDIDSTETQSLESCDLELRVRIPLEFHDPASFE